ncbi:MAG: hypothetical protein HQM10_23540 [Candidatus Riflebacteria bacterium]|nr:hypothetical protein [Candidatus Riflebacteria bacterium]
MIESFLKKGYEEQLAFLRELTKEQLESADFFEKVVLDASISPQVKVEALKAAVRNDVTSLLGWVKENLDSSDEAISLNCLLYLLRFSHKEAIDPIYKFLTSENQNLSEGTRQILKMFKSGKLLRQLAVMFSSNDDNQKMIARTILENLELKEYFGKLGEALAKVPSTEFLDEILKLYEARFSSSEVHLLDPLLKSLPPELKNSITLFRQRILSKGSEQKDSDGFKFPQEQKKKIDLDLPRQKQPKAEPEFSKMALLIAALLVILLIIFVVFRVFFSPPPKIEETSRQPVKTLARSITSKATIIEFKESTGGYLVELENRSRIFIIVQSPDLHSIKPKTLVQIVFSPVKVSSEGLTVALCSDIRVLPPGRQ